MAKRGLKTVLLVGGLLVVVAGGGVAFQTYSDQQYEKELAAAEAEAEANGTEVVIPQKPDPIQMIFALIGQGQSANAAPRSLRSSALPFAYNSWQRTDYLNPRTAQEALEGMVSRTGSQAAQAGLPPSEETGPRIAAVYRNGAERFIIYVDQPALVPIDASAGTEEAATQAVREIEIVGRNFENLGAGRKGVVHLSATYPSGMRVTILGPSSIRAVTPYIEKMDFNALGLR